MEQPPERVVSLVPSETEAVCLLGKLAHLVGRTDYCIEPAQVVASVVSVGGTKSVDVSRVLALEPDLVLANKEENTRSTIEQLITAGMTVHVSFPTTVRASVAYLETLCVLLGVDPGSSRAMQACVDVIARPVADACCDVCVLIWKDPWMTCNEQTFASDILTMAGGRNVFGGRARRYPLAADIGTDEPLGPGRVGDRDTRYPRVTVDEIASLCPSLVLLPDEPYAFTADDGRELQEGLRARGCSAEIAYVDGKHLFWYGPRIAQAIPALAALLSSTLRESAL